MSTDMSKYDKLTMMRLHYSTWFSFAGLHEEAKTLGLNKSINRDTIDKKGTIENIQNENYIFFKSGIPPFTAQVGISDTIVKMLCGEIEVDKVNSQTHYSNKYELYGDGTAVKFY